MTKRILVRLVKGWSSDTPVFRQTPQNDGVWKNVEFTFEDIPKCDYLIVFNYPKEEIVVDCPRKNVWLVAGEPPDISQRFCKKSYVHFTRVYSQHATSFKNQVPVFRPVWWHVSRDINFLRSLRPLDKNDKENEVSTITSSLSNKEGHYKRLKFLDYIKSVGFNFDYFGRGSNPIEDKFDALYPYKYSIAIENSFHKNYWTEKIADCFLSWTMPIYQGASNITSIFPKESMILIDVNKPEKSIEMIRDAIKNQLWEKSLKHIEEARNLVLDKWQMFPFLWQEIYNNQLSNQPLHQEEIRIPRYLAPWEEGYRVSFERKIEYRLRKLLKLRPY